MEIKGIFFDLFGTLFEYGDMESAYYKQALVFFKFFKGINQNLTSNEFNSNYHFLNKPIIPKRLEILQKTIKKFGILTIYEKKIINFGFHLKISLSYEELHKIAELAIDEWMKELKFDPSAILCLDRLKLSKKLALITDFDHPPYIYKILENFNLRSRFEHIVISGEVGIKKPDSRIFNIALKMTNLKPQNVIYIGDSEIADIYGAYRTGLLPVFIQKKLFRRIQKSVQRKILDPPSSKIEEYFPKLSNNCIQECKPIIIQNLKQIDDYVNS